MPRYDVFLEGRAESSTRYFAVSVMADDPKEAEFLGHEARASEAPRVRRNRGRRRYAGDFSPERRKREALPAHPAQERALKFVKEAITNGRKKAH